MPAVPVRRRLVIACAAAPVVAATVVLGGCASLSPQERVEALMKEGQQLYAAKQYDAALAKFKEAIAIDGKYWQAYLWAARTYVVRGLWGNAIADARKAFELAPKGADTLQVFGQALLGGGVDALKGGNFKAAIGHLTEYLKVLPGNAETYLNLGKAFLGERRFGEALGALVNGLKQAGGGERQEFLRTLLEGGRQAFSQNDWRNAAGMLREYVKLDGGNLQAWLDLAKAHWSAGDRGDALSAFKEVLRLNPRHEEALRFLLQR